MDTHAFDNEKERSFQALIAQRLKEQQKNLAWLAKEAGTTPQTILRLIRPGGMENVKVKILLGICAALDIPIPVPLSMWGYPSYESLRLLGLVDENDLREAAASGRAASVSSYATSMSKEDLTGYEDRAAWPLISRLHEGITADRRVIWEKTQRYIRYRFPGRRAFVQVVPYDMSLWLYIGGLEEIKDPRHLVEPSRSGVAPGKLRMRITAETIEYALDVILLQAKARALERAGLNITETTK